ncbi:MAG: prolyl oligopeptidase family serine peptidase [Elusimicrobia bacterium]|nr:prolyl oligopeptidase family serine peptidase [Elusimicrobiota bacterium]
MLAFLAASARAQQAKKTGSSVSELSIEFPLPGGSAGHGIIFAAQGSGREQPAVVVVPDSPRERIDAEVRALSKLLAARGLEVLEISTTGTNIPVEAVLGAAGYLSSPGQANSRRIGILGYGWGGHAALSAVALSSETWSAAVSVGGVSDLYVHYRLTRELPPETPDSQAALWKEKPQLLEGIFPVQALETVRAPILLFHGTDDARVPRQESDRLYARLLQRRVSVGLILYPKEGHAFARAQNRNDFHRRVAEFFDKKLR